MMLYAWLLGVKFDLTILAGSVVLAIIAIVLYFYGEHKK